MGEPKALEDDVEDVVEVGTEAVADGIEAVNDAMDDMSVEPVLSWFKEIMDDISS